MKLSSYHTGRYKSAGERVKHNLKKLGTLNNI